MSVNELLRKEGFNSSLSKPVADYARQIMDKTAAENAYRRCKESMLNQNTPAQNDDSRYCPRNFDGWACWNDTPAGSIAVNPCPSFIIGFDPNRWAHKVCMENGEWFRHPDTNVTWSNYTTCVDLEGLAMHQRSITVYISGYSISLVALVISLFIFFYFRSLRCTRITIHKNLFASFIINNTMWIVWFTVIVNTPVVFENGIGCQILHVLLQYFLVCNYFWMFCEGLYLHTVLVFAFVNDENIMKWLLAIGWGIPAILTSVYAYTRSSFPEEAIHCWIDDGRFTWILTVPVCISMLANLIFLVNIVKVLVTKLRAVNTSDTNQTRKAARATVILIPLLGLHYIVTPFRPQEKTPWAAVYAIVSAVVTSFQGLCVALLFCIFNSEVTAVIRKKWRQHRQTFNRRFSVAGTSISLVTPQHSLPGPTSNHEEEALSNTKV
ncbi:hypothetical protein CHUAL_011822 [Chamberlinius hualienensis]